MPTPIVRIHVTGTPAPQGSKKGYANRYNGRVSMIESSTRVRPWRDAVIAAVHAQTHPTPTMMGPVRADITFVFKRPKSHYLTRGRGLKPDAPIWATSRACGDLDKLQRATFDGLTDSGIIDDDSQITAGYMTKRYAHDASELPGAIITLHRLDADAHASESE